MDEFVRFSTVFRPKLRPPATQPQCGELGRIIVCESDKEPVNKYGGWRITEKKLWSRITLLEA